jgi:hypothetical protein
VWLQTSERWRLFPPCPESCAAGRSLIASSRRCTKQKQKQSQSHRNGNRYTCVVDYLSGRLCWRGYFLPCDAASSIAQLLNCPVCGCCICLRSGPVEEVARMPVRAQLDHRDQTTNKTTHPESPPFFISTSSRLFYQSSKQASKQSINQSSDREPAPPPVLFCSLLAAPHPPSCHRDAASAPRR